MANEPKYVRLAERLTGQVLVDITSGWSISGLDVKEFPDKEKYPRAARFVRDKLRRGALEPASSAEYEEVEEVHEQSRQALSDKLHELAEVGMADRLGLAVHQEASVQQQARERRERVRDKREQNTENADGDTPAEAAGEEEEDEGYQSWTNEQLREELDSRELSTTGNKADLVARLEEDDEENNEENS